VRAPASASGTGFVQVGSFSDPVNAARTRAALESRGLPVVEREVRASGGTVLRVVLAGPFAAQADARAAMATARSLGFRDAFLRR